MSTLNKLLFDYAILKHQRFLTFTWRGCECCKLFPCVELANWLRHRFSYRRPCDSLVACFYRRSVRLVFCAYMPFSWAVKIESYITISAVTCKKCWVLRTGVLLVVLNTEGTKCSWHLAAVPLQKSLGNYRWYRRHQMRAFAVGFILAKSFDDRLRFESILPHAYSASVGLFPTVSCSVIDRALRRARAIDWNFFLSLLNV